MRAYEEVWDKGSRCTMRACLCLRGGGKGGDQWKGKGVRGRDGGNKGVSRGVMVCFVENDLRMDAAANIQTAYKISLTPSPLV